MITERGIKQLKRYCREPIENIKGYREATDSEGRYDCHHINELTFTRDELIKMNMYYDRPASELIIMSHSDHLSWHNKWNGNPMSGRSGDMHPMYGRTGDKHPSYGRTLDKNSNWKGDKAGVSAMYARAKKLYKAGQITENELKQFRDAWNEYRKTKRKKCAQ